MKTALKILTDKKAEFFYPGRNVDEAALAWVNFMEGMLLIACVNALCSLHDGGENEPRLAAALGRDAGLLLNLGEDAVPLKCFELLPTKLTEAQRSKLTRAQELVEAGGANENLTKATVLLSEVLRPNG